MPKRSRKKPAKDFNQVARSIVDQATGSTPKKRRPAKKAEKAKDPAAVALGRKGGLVGGHARAGRYHEVVSFDDPNATAKHPRKVVVFEANDLEAQRAERKTRS